MSQTEEKGFDLIYGKLNAKIKELHKIINVAAEAAWKADVMKTNMQKHISETKEEWIDNKIKEWGNTTCQL